MIGLGMANKTIAANLGKTLEYELGW